MIDVFVFCCRCGRGVGVFCYVWSCLLVVEVDVEVDDGGVVVLYDWVSYFDDLVGVGDVLLGVLEYWYVCVDL